jgi:hypothetical protein
VEKKMITDKDERTFTKSRYIDKFHKAIDIAWNKIIQNQQEYSEYDWGMDRIQVNKVTKAFDKIIYESGGFELDGRSLRHAHGIGNNNEWDIVDKDLIKIGNFYCNSDMFGGVYIGIEVNGDIIKKAHLR